jgi:hypothetical protein
MTIGTGERSNRLHAVLRHCGHDQIGPSEVEDQSKDAISSAVFPPPDKNGNSEWMALILLLLPDHQDATSAFGWTLSISF